MKERYSTFQEFWPYYVTEHTKSGTRVLHFIGTTLLVLLVIVALVSGEYWLVPAGIVAAYGFAWMGHFVIEKNRPATFQYPFFSLLGDFKMYGLMWRGKMGNVLSEIKESPFYRKRALP